MTKLRKQARHYLSNRLRDTFPAFVDSAKDARSHLDEGALNYDRLFDEIVRHALSLNKYFKTSPSYTGIAFCEWQLEPGDKGWSSVSWLKPWRWSYNIKNTSNDWSLSDIDLEELERKGVKFCVDLMWLPGIYNIVYSEEPPYWDNEEDAQTQAATDREEERARGERTH